MPEIEWARDDLRDVLFDLKQAVAARDHARADAYMMEAIAMLREIERLLE